MRNLVEPSIYEEYGWDDSNTSDALTIARYVAKHKAALLRWRSKLSWTEIKQSLGIFSSYERILVDYDKA